MRLALLWQGFFLVATSRGFDFAKPFSAFQSSSATA
jgi:hypothetical protein